MITLRVLPPQPVKMGAESTPPVALQAGAQKVLVDDYNVLENKPSIEGVPLIGDQSFAQLHMNSLTNAEIEALLNLD